MLATITESEESNGRWWTARDASNGAEVCATRYGHAWCAKLARERGYTITEGR